MPRLSDDQVNELKRSASLVEYATGQGHALKQKGDEYALRCPFHDDKTPSCYINPEKNLFYCHGCGETEGWPASLSFYAKNHVTL